MDTPDILFQYLKEIIYNTEDASLDLDILPPEFRKLGEGMQLLGKWMGETKKLSADLARGELSCHEIDRGNVFAAPMKDLQSSLRHLAWQTQQIAKGDYSQTVDFMGEFSESFNAMTSQLRKKSEELEQKERVLFRLAYTDSLTNLYNQRYAMEHMRSWREQGLPFLISFIDVDYLKYWNDTKGHKFGDEYLVETAEALKALGGVLCRTGGDEFMILERDRTLEEQNRELEKVREMMEVSEESKECPRSFSYASCEVPENPEKTLEEYISMADALMYRYKAEKRKHLQDISYKDNRAPEQG